MGGLLAAVVSSPGALSLGTLSGLGLTAGIDGAVGVCAVTALFGGTRGSSAAPTRRWP